MKDCSIGALKFLASSEDQGRSSHESLKMSSCNDSGDGFGYKSIERSETAHEGAVPRVKPRVFNLKDKLLVSIRLSKGTAAQSKLSNLGLQPLQQTQAVEVEPFFSGRTNRVGEQNKHYGQASAAEVLMVESG